MTESDKPADNTKLHTDALLRFKRYAEAWSKQRKREKDDLRFQVPEFQWDDTVRADREGNRTDNIPPRPTLSITLIQQPIQLIENQERASDLGVNIHPLSAEANKETAEVIQGKYREIERDRDYPAQAARRWGFDRAVKAGFGAYLVNTVWDESSDSPFDQKVVLQRVLDGAAVLLDPSATKPDFSDGESGFYTVWVPKATFERDYPDAQLPTQDAMTLLGDSVSVPDWIMGNGDAEAFLVATEFYKKHNVHKISLLETGEVVDDVPDGAKVLQERMIDDLEVWVCKHSGVEIVEGPQKWNGKYIPIIPVIGTELQPFSGERYWVGMIAPTKDAQRFQNYSASAFAEGMALESKVPFVGAAGQFKGFEKKWGVANTRALPYLEYNPKASDGTEVGPPQRVQVDMARTSLAAMGMQESAGWVQGLTSTYDASLGKLSQKDRSGVAIERQQSQSDASNSHYLHNLADVSMRYEAVVVLDLIPNVYDREGRVTKIINGEDEVSSVMLNAPHTMDNEGNPQPVPMDAQGQPMPVQGAQTFDLRKGIYGVDISIGKSYQTAMAAAADEIGQVLQADPQLINQIGNIYFENRDFPGAKQIAEVLKKIRNVQYPFLAQPDPGQKPTPEQMEAQLQSLQTQNQQLQQQLQQAAQAQATDQAKQQATLQKAQMDNEAKAQLGAASDAVKVQIAKLQAEVELLKTGMIHGHEQTAQVHDMAHDSALSAQEHAQNMEAAKAQAGEDAKIMAAQAELQAFKGAGDQSLGSDEGV